VMYTEPNPAMWANPLSAKPLGVLGLGFPPKNGYLDKP
jgi:hypothetical protein